MSLLKSTQLSKMRQGSAEYFRILERNLDQLGIHQIVQCKVYTVATLPTASAGHLIYVSDETGGSTLAFGDGTDWRRVQDRAVVS